MESAELIRRLLEQGYVAELIVSSAGDPLIRIDGLGNIPLLWAARLALGEISFVDIKEDLLN